MTDGLLEFTVERNANPASDEVRASILANPGFGQFHTDHMVSIDYTADTGWHDPRVTAYGPIELDPSAIVLHYAQEIFEGLKAYRNADGSITSFRPEANAKRFRDSAARMAMPAVSDQMFVGAIDELVRIDRDWVPDDPEASLYLRPFMYASEVFLGVRPANEYLFVVIASAVGSYFKGGVKPVTVWISSEYTRAAPGGTGAAKCGGNYAASLSATAEAIEHGCDQVVFLDAVRRKYVDELGGMNVFFVYDDGSLVTPPLKTILPGITRDSLITLARASGRKVKEKLVSMDSWRADAASGRLVEVFACGTAAVVTPIGTVRSVDGEFQIADGGTGPVTAELRKALVDIQRGRAADPYNWVHRII